MKTPKEIKKALKLCGRGCYTGCPYNSFECVEEMSRDALTYIQQLENQLREATKKMERIEAAQPKWISVNERLPEPDREILLIAHGWKERLLYIGCLHHMSAETSWLTGITSKKSEWLIYGWSYLKEPTVTHWMPLPESPKEDA